MGLGPGENDYGGVFGIDWEQVIGTVRYRRGRREGWRGCGFLPVTSSLKIILKDEPRQETNNCENSS